ncbi:MAG: TIGR02099 family protein [Methylophaga sp.]|nr:MAG: TIGR02099 family protein [Methylophaga sp.]
MIIHGLKIAARQLIYLSIILAVILTLLVATVYWLSNAVEQRQDEIASWLSEKMGYPVKIGAASLDWIGLEPKLQIGDVALLTKDGQKEIIVLGSLHLGLDLIASVQRGQPVLNDMALNGLKLTVIRDYSGQFQLQGFILPAASSRQEFDWKSWAKLLDDVHFENLKVDYIDQLNSALSGSYELVSGTIIHQDAQWSTAGTLKLPSSLGKNIVFTAQAELNDDASQVGEWQGQAKISNAQIALLADGFDLQGIIISKGAVTADISVTGTGSHVTVATTDFKLFQAELANHNTNFPAVALDSIQGNMDWKQTEESWQLSGRTLLSINGDDWPETAFSINGTPQGDVQLIAQYLRLSDLTSIALLSNKTPEIIQHQQPAGDVEALSLYYSAENGLTELAFKLKEGVILPWQDYPGVTNLTVQVNWQNGFGNVRLDSRDLTLYAKPWLDDALFFDSIVGVLQLEYEQQKWQLYSQGLRVWNDDLTLQLDGEIKKENDGKIINDLKVTLEDIAVKQWKKYVPTKNFHADFKEWSNNTFVAGKITKGEIILKGDLAEFPYQKEPDKGQFKMVLQAENVQLHYALGWPGLYGLTGTITSSGNDLIIRTKQGKTAGFDFIDVTTTIKNIIEDEPVLWVKGDVTGTTAKALQFLEDSPLKERFGVVAELAVAKGSSNINLDLMVPLVDTDNTTIAGYVSFKDSQLHYKASPEIGLTQVNGKLYFSEKGVKAKNITAIAFNEAVTIDVKPDGDKAIISVLSYIDTKQINKVWPGEVPDYITGRTAYKMNLTVVERTLGKFYLDVDLSSDLTGLAFAMPTPLGKVAEQKIPFKATIQNIDNSLVYTTQYGDVLNAIAKPKKDLWQGEIRFGKGKAALPNNGIKITGQLAEISVDDWFDWAGQQQAGGKTPLVDSIDELSLEFGKLTGFEQTVTDLNLVSQKDAEGWRINVDSKQARGFIYLPNDLTGSAAIKINLAKLALTLPKKFEDDKQADEDLPMNLWPSVDISIDSLILDEKPLGTLNIQAKKSANQWVISSGTLTSNVFDLSVIKGVWSKAAEKDNTRLQLQLESSDLDLLLANLGYQEAIDAETVIIAASVSWPSTPLNFTMSDLSGTLNMDIGKGTLQDVEPGAAGRMFGLMSITALPRRLSLDFNDLFGKGFTFDSITGDFNFKNGLAFTDNFMLKSASAEIKITGAVDLVNQQYNQQVKITPNVSSTLPLAGAVAGGPVGLGVGTAILLVDKLTGKLFDKNIINIISYKYDLTGPWDEPSLVISKPSQQSNGANVQSNVIKK